MSIIITDNNRQKIIPDFPKIQNRTETSFTIEWEYIRKKLRITKYTIKAEILKTYASQSFYDPPEFVVASGQDRYEITNLHPGTEYNITLIAKCGEDICDTVSIIDETLIGIPDPEPFPLAVIEETKTTRTIQINPTYNNNGPITSYRIVVEVMDNQLNQFFNESLIGTYYQSIDDGTNYYIAGEKDFINATELFVVGDGSINNGFYNPPLPENDNVFIFLGLVSERYNVIKVRYGRTGHDQPAQHTILDPKKMNIVESSVTVLTVACGIVSCLFVISILIYFYLRYRTVHLHRLTENHGLNLSMGEAVSKKIKLIIFALSC